MPATCHGTPHGYDYWGCRKDCCREAKIEYQRTWRQDVARRSRGPIMVDIDRGTLVSLSKGTVIHFEIGGITVTLRPTTE